MQEQPNRPTVDRLPSVREREMKLLKAEVAALRAVVEELHGLIVSPKRSQLTLVREDPDDG